MLTKKVTYIIIGFMLIFTAGKAQYATPFTMSPIASSTGGIVITGTPIVVNGTGKCLTVNSGLSTLNINNNGKGTFGASCVETAPVATVISVTSVTLYPNPTQGMTILKCAGQFDANLSCQIRVISIDGKPMMSKMVPMKDVVAGYQINAAGYPAGNYVVTMEFMNQQYSVKLIKL